MIFAAWSAVKLRPIASTKSPSGSANCQSLPAIIVQVLQLTHQVKVDAMIHKIILPWLHAARCAKVHSVRLACVLDLIIVARQSNELWVELGEIFLQDLWSIACRIAGNHERKQHFAALLNHLVVHECHLVELVGADVGAVGEAEVDL
jgi:hypothetical protein